MPAKPCVNSRLAQAMIDCLTRDDLDFTLLLWLKVPSVLTPETALGKDLRAFLARYGLDTDDFVVSHRNQKDLRGFFQTVRSHFLEHRYDCLERPRFLQEIGSGGKKKIIEEYQSKSDWRRPCKPYAIQTRASVKSKSAWMVFKTWQEAVKVQAELLSTSMLVSGTDVVKIEQVYEHRWAEENSVTRLIVDWELLHDLVQDRLTLDELQAVCESFPAWTVKSMRDKGILNASDTIECVVKEKSRPIRDTFKVSRHFVFNIVGRVETDHEPAMLEILEPWRQKIKGCAALKSYASVSDDDLKLPVWGVDSVMIRGSNGISTLFGCKSGEDKAVSLPRIACRMLIKPDGAVEYDRAWADTPAFDLAKMPREMAYDALFEVSYTLPSLNMVAYASTWRSRIISQKVSWVCYY